MWISFRFCDPRKTCPASYNLNTCLFIYHFRFFLWYEGNLLFAKNGVAKKKIIVEGTFWPSKMLSHAIISCPILIAFYSSKIILMTLSTNTFLHSNTT